MTTKRKAVSYARFSHPDQAGGDTEDRQARDFRRFCELHGLEPLPDAYLDKARSGYKGKHLKGKFGELLAAAKAGKFEKGTVIVVEAWDRLGRLRPDEQVALVSDLLKTGVVVGVCRINDTFAEEDFGNHKWTVFSTFAQLAYQESKQKGERVAAALAEKRRRAREGVAQRPTRRMGDDCLVMTRRLPGWVEEHGGRLRLVPGRAETVRLIYRLAAQGHGYHSITRRLNDSGAEPFGPSAAWNKSYVSHILRDRRAAGEMQPMKGRRPDGPPVKGYFPAAVSEAEWGEARAGAAERKRFPTGRHGKRANLFAGMMTDAVTGGSYCATRRVSGDGRGRRVLVTTSSTQAGESARGFPLDTFEAAVLSVLHEIRADEVTPPAGGPPPSATLEAQRAAARAELKAAKEWMDTHKFSPTIAERITEVEGRVADLDDRIAACPAVPAAETLTEVKRLLVEFDKAGREVREKSAAVRPALESGDDARLRLRASLRRLIDGVTVLVERDGNDRLLACQIHFAGTARTRHVEIRHRPARSNGVRTQPGRWWVRSSRRQTGPGVYDMRTAEGLESVRASLLHDFEIEPWTDEWGEPHDWEAGGWQFTHTEEIPANRPEEEQRRPHHHRPAAPGR